MPAALRPAATSINLVAGAGAATVPAFRTVHKARRPLSSTAAVRVSAVSSFLDPAKSGRRMLDARAAKSITINTAMYLVLGWVGMFAANRLVPNMYVARPAAARSSSLHS